MSVKEIVWFAVGAVVLAGTITIGFSYYNQGRKYAATVEEQGLIKLQEKEEYFLTRYDGLEPTGKDVIKYIKINIDKVDSITVTTNKRTFVADESQFELYQISTSEYYINPLKTFEIVCNRNKNGSITSINIKIV